MSEKQHDFARRALAVIERTAPGEPPLTYQRLAKAIGVDPATYPRQMAQVCDLLDAAAAMAGIPLLALVKVLNADEQVNRAAWVKGNPPGFREQVLANSFSHEFLPADYRAIEAALAQLGGLGNHKAWEKVRELRRGEVTAIVTMSARPHGSRDAVNDLPGTDHPVPTFAAGMRYQRDPKVRALVIERARGRCEYCDAQGFELHYGGHYVETHHVIALAEDGADRVTNVIALCANHHRESHYGAKRLELEAKFLEVLERKTREA